MQNRRIALIMSVVFLCLAVIPGLPYGFFTLLRLLVCGATAYTAWLAFRNDNQLWTWIHGFIALVFNPIFSLHLGRALWTAVDLTVAVILIISMFAFKLPKGAA